MSAAQETCDVVCSLAEEQDFQQVLNICSDAFDGLDYMPVTFHRWLHEPGRLVFITRMKNRVVALESALLVDGGQTGVFQGLRVAPDLRGRGIAGALQRHIHEHIRLHHPQVSAVRLGRGDQPSPQTLAKYRLIAKEPVEANMEVLRRRGLTWIVDREFEPTTFSLCTTPYAVPYRHDALHFNINIFGRSLASVCSVFVAQLEALLPSLKGYLVFYTYVDPEVWSGLHQFCQNNSRVSFFHNYCEEVILEKDL